MHLLLYSLCAKNKDPFYKQNLFSTGGHTMKNAFLLGAAVLIVVGSNSDAFAHSTNKAPADTQANRYLSGLEGNVELITRRHHHGHRGGHFRGHRHGRHFGFKSHRHGHHRHHFGGLHLHKHYRPHYRPYRNHYRGGYSYRGPKYYGYKHHRHYYREYGPYGYRNHRY